MIPANILHVTIGDGHPSAILLLAFSWGLAGGFSHCIGMCGVFVAAYTAPNNGNRTGASVGLGRHVLFHGGRLLALVSLGVIAGAIGSIDHRWAAAQGGVSIVAGIVMLGLALGFAGILPWFRIPEPDIMGAGGGWMRKLFVRALQSHGRFKPLIIGIFVGLLPCGLTYQALIPAATSGSVTQACLIMTLFCIGTIPGLLMLGVFGNALFGGLLMQPRFRNAMTRVAAAIMGIMGLEFVWRGIGGF